MSNFQAKPLKLDIQKVVLAQAKECLNISDLAEKAEIPRTTISNILNGRRNASPKTIGKIARALNLDVIELLSNE